MDDLNFPNPMALTSYLLENKDFFLRYCDDDGSQIRTAKTALLMYAASVDGRAKAKDDQLANIADNKIKVYNFEWNDANSNLSAAGAVDILKDLPFEEKVDIIEDVTSVFEAGGDISEKQQGFIDYLKESFGIDDDGAEDEDEDKADSPMTKEEILEAAASNPRYKDVYEFLERDSILSHVTMNEILSQEPHSPSDLWPLLDQVRQKNRDIFGLGPSDNQIEIRKAKLGIIMVAAIADGGMNDKEQEAVSQIANSFEYRVPNPNYKAIFDEYKGEKSLEVLKKADYGERVRLINSVDYIFGNDLPVYTNNLIKH